MEHIPKKGSILLETAKQVPCLQKEQDEWSVGEPGIQIRPSGMHEVCLEFGDKLHKPRSSAYSRLFTEELKVAFPSPVMFVKKSPDSPSRERLDT
jgi:hypothetical protein